MTPEPQTCRWFVGCRDWATTTRPHPVLGEVPCCDGCAAFVDDEPILPRSTAGVVGPTSARAGVRP